MSAHKQVLLYCDAEQCARYRDETFDAGGFYSSAVSVRASAKASGWTRKNGKDYCDTCSKKMEKTK